MKEGINDSASEESEDVDEDTIKKVEAAKHKVEVHNAAKMMWKSTMHHACDIVDAREKEERGEVEPEVVELEKEEDPKDTLM
jgi:hypothetical protein